MSSNNTLGSGLNSTTFWEPKTTKLSRHLGLSSSHKSRQCASGSCLLRLLRLMSLYGVQGCNRFCFIRLYLPSSQLFGSFLNSLEECECFQVFLFNSWHERRNAAVLRGGRIGGNLAIITVLILCGIFAA